MALYTPEILNLATQLVEYPLQRDFSHQANARSRTCGSVIEVGIDCDDAGTINIIGMRVSACAIGQASAAIMARGVIGRRPAEVVEARTKIAKWLAQDGALPDWPELDLIKPALLHKGRHGALILPWTAATEALCSAVPGR